MNRRKMLQSLAAGFGAAFGGGLTPSQAFGMNATPSPMKRVIFFLQNQGFDPATCIPSALKNSGSLANAKLPEPIEALEPFKERMHIINGLHGLHTSPSHSPFLALWAVIGEAMGFHRLVPPSITNLVKSFLRFCFLICALGWIRSKICGPNRPLPIFRRAVRDSRFSCIPIPITCISSYTDGSPGVTFAISMRLVLRCLSESKAWLRRMGVNCRRAKKIAMDSTYGDLRI